MQPIQDILNRIRWDKAFGQGDFSIGYYDRVEKRVVRVPFSELDFEPGDHFSFELTDIYGEIHSIPYHRICDVYRNGELIWHREVH